MNKMTRARANRRTAVHEAGHAVIGRVLKQVCGPASIRPNPAEDEAGYSICADPYDTLGYWDDLGRWRGPDALVSIICGRIMIYMAGRAAEEEFFGSCAGGDGDDRRQINLMLDRLLPSDADVPHYAKRLRSHTQALVRRHRDAIACIAALLLARKTLQSEEIERALAE
jgi:ATP-dependent Zn protease